LSLDQCILDMNS